MNRKIPVPFLGEGTAATPSPYPTSQEKRNDMFKGLLPPQQCRWCKNSLDAGEMTCQVCRGNRLAPRRWWPVTAASLLLLVFTLCAMGILLVAIRTADGTPAASVSPVATPAGAGAASQSPIPTQTPTATANRTTRTRRDPRTHAYADDDAHAGANCDGYANTRTDKHANCDAYADSYCNGRAHQHARTHATATPTTTPVPLPDPRFRPHQTSIRAGGCTVLHWNVDGVQAVFLDGAGRPGHSSEKVCPQETRRYTLRLAIPDGRQGSDVLDIRVPWGLCRSI